MPSLSCRNLCDKVKPPHFLESYALFYIISHGRQRNDRKPGTRTDSEGLHE